MIRFSVMPVLLSVIQWAETLEPVPPLKNILHTEKFLMNLVILSVKVGKRFSRAIILRSNFEIQFFFSKNNSVFRSQGLATFLDPLININ